MGKLRVSFEVQLGTHMMAIGSAGWSPVVFRFNATGNSVTVDPPKIGTDEEQTRGVRGYFNIHVERDCSDSEGKSYNFETLRKYQFESDAARAFWIVLERIREYEFRQKHLIPGYPVVLSEEIQENPLAQSCDIVWTYESSEVMRGRLGGHPMLSIDEDSWNSTVTKGVNEPEISPHLRFALDACYFLRGDPSRTIIMACAAWETALRYFLAKIASQKDSAYELAAEMPMSIPKLLDFAQAARGQTLFADDDPNLSTFRARQRKTMKDLPSLRNSLLHKGVAIPSGINASEVALTVLNAIDWLFE